MKILYMITTLGHGRGGHFHDLRVTANSISNQQDVIIIEVGLKQSPIINSMNLKIYNLYFNGINFLIVLNRIFKILIKERPTVIHCFDTQSFSFARIAGFLKKIPIVLSKCGGPNPSFYPYTNNLIVMSKENFDFFKDYDKFKKSKIHYIPNRSLVVKNDFNAINEIKKIAGSSKIFLHISRITEYYENSINQSINLIKDIRFEKDVKLFIVGIVESSNTLNRLMKISNNSIIFLTDDLFTENSAKVISVADFVIATGRGVMEAASKSKILLTPLKGAKYPVLIKDSNFEYLYNTNFSPRNYLNNNSEEKNLSDIIKVMDSTFEKNKLKNFIDKIYLEKFDINEVLDSYYKIYNEAILDNRIRFFNFMRNMISTIKTVLFKRYSI